MLTKQATRLLFGLLLIGASFGANANLITNGTFDENLDGWIIEDGQTRWVEGTAQLGAPGQEMTSLFSQLFSIAPETDHLKLWFDYEWQVEAPLNPDNFIFAFLYYDAEDVLNFIPLFGESSSDAAFGETVQFSTQLSLTGLSLVDGLNNVGILFSLEETVNASGPGTRIELDNIRAEVPAPATLALFGLGLAGLGWSRRKKA